MIHLLVPMSGLGTRYHKAGYTVPKPLVPVGNKLMIERVLECFPESWPSVFVMATQHLETELPKELKKLRANAVVSSVKYTPEGPIDAIEEGLKHIPENEPVFVSYCDYGMVWDARQFERFITQTECDACVISYTGFHAHYLNPQTYAYSRLEGERVVEMKEKGSFTDKRENEFASSGGYYFRSAKLLKSALKYQREKTLKANGEFYTSLTVQAVLELNPKAHVRVFEIPAFFQWGTPQDLRRFEYWEQTYANFNRIAGQSRPTTEQVLMPMAGLGSRFKDHSKYPKPFIPVNDQPMFLNALNSLPKAKKTAIVGLKDFSPIIKKIETKTAGIDFELLESTPPGQALSTQSGFKKLDPAKEVIVSSCDHGIVLNGEKWNRFQSKPDADAAIFTIRGFPGANERPTAFAYVVPKSSDASEFQLVENVSVKVTVSQTPSQDNLLVGTFWFSSAKLMNEVIDELVEKNIRVNNELYLDSVFNLLIEKKKKVRIIPLDGYINWGDPESLAEALYWYEVFCARRLTKREKFPGIERVW